MLSHRQRFGCLVASAGLALTAAACGSSSASTTNKPTVTAPTAVTTTTAKALTSSTVTLNGTSYPVPTESGSTPITPFSDTGQQVVLTASGALPRTLYSALHQPVIFTNLTAHPLTLSILHVGLPPVTVTSGGTYAYTPTVLAFAYRASNGAAGIVNVDAFGQQ
jgi:hypothetical protein